MWAWEQLCPIKTHISKLSLAAAEYSCVWAKCWPLPCSILGCLHFLGEQRSTGRQRQSKSKWLENSWRKGEVQCVKWRSEVRNVKNAARLTQCLGGGAVCLSQSRRCALRWMQNMRRKKRKIKKWWWTVIERKTDTWEINSDSALVSSLNVRRVNGFRDGVFEGIWALIVIKL